MTTGEAVHAHIFDMAWYSNRIFRTSFPEQRETPRTAKGRQDPLIAVVEPPKARRIEAERPR
jgi:hypothetical protein